MGERDPVRARLIGVDPDIGRAMRVANALRFGCVWINDHIPIVAEMPHGGYKQSGYGKDLSMYSVEDYTEVKHVMVNIETRARRGRGGDAGPIGTAVASAAAVRPGGGVHVDAAAAAPPTSSVSRCAR